MTAVVDVWPWALVVRVWTGGIGGGGGGAAAAAADMSMILPTTETVPGPTERAQLGAHTVWGPSRPTSDRCQLACVVIRSPKLSYCFSFAFAYPGTAFFTVLCLQQSVHIQSMPFRL